VGTPRRRHLLRRIQATRPDAAIAWGYSVWRRDAAGRQFPRPEHLYNQKRSLVIFAELQDLGMPAIPNVYWGLRRDLDRWAVWLADNPCVPTIAMDLQTVANDSDWREMIRDLEYFSSVVSRDIKCLFSGICEVSRVQGLREVWPNSSLSNFGPYFGVVFPKKTAYGLRPRFGQQVNWTPTHIFHDAVAQYTALMGGYEAGNYSPGRCGFSRGVHESASADMGRWVVTEAAVATDHSATGQARERAAADELAPLQAAPEGQLPLFRPVSERTRAR
jgi:hypothetical protein